MEESVKSVDWAINISRISHTSTMGSTLCDLLFVAAMVGDFVFFVNEKNVFFDSFFFLNNDHGLWIVLCF